MTDQPITWTRSYNSEVGGYEYRTTFMVDDIEVYLTGTQFCGRKAKKTRVYVSGEPKVDFSEAKRLSNEAGTWERGASVEADKAWDSANRALVQSKKDFLEALIHTIPVLGDVLSDHKLNFNRKAGCSCGCSPGFVADAMLRLSISAERWTAGQLEDFVIVLSDVSAYKRTKKEVAA